MGGVANIPTYSERPRRTCRVDKVAEEIKHTVDDRATCLENSRYMHGLGKQGIWFIDLSGPERSKIYYKETILVH